MAYGVHFTDTYAGRVFCQRVTPLGLAIPIYTGTAIAGSLPIWNPPGSNVIVEVVSYDITYGSGTSEYGNIGIMGLPLNSIATGSPCTAFAATTPINMYLGGGQASKVQSSGAGTVTVTAGAADLPTATTPGWLRTLTSMNLEAQTGTAHGNLIVTYDLKGTLAVPPGYMVYLAGSRAVTALMASSVIWKEIPVAG